MKPSEIRAKGEKELLKTAQEKTAELFGLQLQRSVGQLAKPANLKMVKKDIARILTIMREKELKLDRGPGTVDQGKKTEDRRLKTKSKKTKKAVEKGK
ncbi:MAG: 50S ribosomal protein L29 [Deltaproteobacteria bacterium]|nr:50S ribosomal protein L29 [Deltaproteobacteria bacterium]MDZ4224659.1 50S ribosomal protein L29 [bacterium]